MSSYKSYFMRNKSFAEYQRPKTVRGRIPDVINNVVVTVTKYPIISANEPLKVPPVNLRKRTTSISRVNSRRNSRMSKQNLRRGASATKISSGIQASCSNSGPSAQTPEIQPPSLLDTYAFTLNALYDHPPGEKYVAKTMTTLRAIDDKRLGKAQVILDILKFSEGKRLKIPRKKGLENLDIVLPHPMKIDETLSEFTQRMNSNTRKHGTIMSTVPKKTLPPPPPAMAKTLPSFPSSVSKKPLPYVTNKDPGERNPVDPSDVVVLFKGQTQNWLTKFGPHHTIQDIVNNYGNLVSSTGPSLSSNCLTRELIARQNYLNQVETYLRNSHHQRKMPSNSAYPSSLKFMRESEVYMPRHKPSRSVIYKPDIPLHKQLYYPTKRPLKHVFPNDGILRTPLGVQIIYDLPKPVEAKKPVMKPLSHLDISPVAFGPRQGHHFVKPKKQEKMGIEDLTPGTMSPLIKTIFQEMGKNVQVSKEVLPYAPRNLRRDDQAPEDPEICCGGMMILIL